MQSRLDYEKLEKGMLAPYAQLSSTSLGRLYPEDECLFRTRFQRDISRIIHTTAFRRLEYKTQVFVNHEGDYFRTRLTHTLEVSQISRGLARILRLNEDLAHAISLAHDLGHTPFGHPGEEAVNKLMESDGGFEHNLQSYRVVTELEDRYPNFRGLNLAYEVLEGILKHTTDYDKPKAPAGFKDVGHATLEAQVVNFADQIAFMSHDLDDGLQCGMLSAQTLKDVTIWDETFRETQEKIPLASDKVKRFRTISSIINKLITDVQAESGKRISEKNIMTLEDVRTNGKNVISLSEGMKKETEELKKFLFENMYRHPQVLKMTRKAHKVINELFTAYLNNPHLMPGEFARQQDPQIMKRNICDYIAGMTDRFALQEHKKIFKISD